LDEYSVWMALDSTSMLMIFGPHDSMLMNEIMLPIIQFFPVADTGNAGAFVFALKCPFLIGQL